ncbi:hypothetical protein [Rhodococcus ruber]|uniref:hypothetical protein n=1 Tax=Rhodococcus ruber TaxID=1830 RepID=UPI000F531513|nr:hypothetical protein [Rhodococcus ruber]MDO1481781.1 hypothetical protein [Rhodococcus ruber]RQM32624.1 hypothetical protein TN91_19535 [Rhodococcus ruber]
MDAASHALSDALHLLRRTDARIVAGSLDGLDLVLPDGREVAAHVTVQPRPPTPHLLAKLRSKHPESRLLVVTPRTTAHLRALAHDGAVDVIAPDEELLVVLGTRYDVLAPAPAPTPPVRPGRGRKPWIRWATERALLLAEHPMTQPNLAAALEVTQQAVSLAVRQSRHLHRRSGGWIAEPRATLLDEHLTEYPGPGGASTYWYGLDPVLRQATDAARFCAELGVPVLQSGDVAADVYAPWRLPTRAVLYVPQFLDFTAAGFTPATADAHTLKVIVPADPTLWRTARMVSDAPSLLVDPVIATHDVLRSPGPDAHEAAGHLRRAIVEGAFRG